MPKYLAHPNNKVVEIVPLQEAATLLSRGWRVATKEEVVEARHNGLLIDDRE